MSNISRDFTLNLRVGDIIQKLLLSSLHGDRHEFYHQHYHIWTKTKPFPVIFWDPCPPQISVKSVLLPAVITLKNPSIRSSFQGNIDGNTARLERPASGREVAVERHFLLFIASFLF